MTEESVVAAGFVDFLSGIIQNNWSLVTGLVVAYFLYHFAKVSVNIVMGLIFVAVAISMMTGIGILPPLDELILKIKEVISNVSI